MFSDKDSEFGPPDKRAHFSAENINEHAHGAAKSAQVTIGQEVEVRYDDNVWYKGKLIELNEETDEWIAQFYIKLMVKNVD